MKIIHAISDLGLKSGGPSLSTYLLVKGLRATAVDAEIVTSMIADPSDAAITGDDFVHAVLPPRCRRWGYSKVFREALAAQREVDLFHAHGLWQYSAYAAVRCARRRGVPYLISPRGMLHPEALRVSGVLKRVALALYQRSDLRGAACLHATCEQEHDFIRACGFSGPVAVVPNPVELSARSERCAACVGRRRVGFVGRIDPIKNVESLLDAWALVRASEDDWELVIVGGGEPDYLKALSERVKRLRLGNVRFTGFLWGCEKESVVGSFRYLVLPSKSENFGMVVPEALLLGVPVIASKGTPWAELEGRSANGVFSREERCGWWVERDAESLSVALRDAISLDDATWKRMGSNGRRLVEARYGVAVVAAEMARVYRWIASGGEAPANVRFA